jgi:hypothetical protein
MLDVAYVLLLRPGTRSNDVTMRCATALQGS